MTDERKREGLSPEEEAVLIAARKKAQAEAEQADERALLLTVGMGAFGFVMLAVSAYALVVRENVVVGATGAVIGMVSFGIITAAQGLRAAGKGD